jgi:hypothetical protein
VDDNEALGLMEGPQEGRTEVKEVGADDAEGSVGKGRCCLQRRHRRWRSGRRCARRGGAILIPSFFSIVWRSMKESSRHTIEVNEGMRAGNGVKNLKSPGSHLFW